MSKPIRDQFEEAIRNNIESGYEDFEPYFTGVDRSAEKCESIADTEAIEFAKWINEIGFKKYAEGWCEAGGSNGWHCSDIELLNKFKSEHYKQVK